MNISGLKPFRQYSEHDVINMFATTGVLDKGTLVAVNAAAGNTNLFQNTGATVTPYQTVTTAFGLPPAYAYHKRGEVAWTVKAAGPTDVCIGMLLYDVKETNRHGENFRYQPTYERYEQQISLVGEATPIVRRGLFMTDNIMGTAALGSGFTASGGKLVPQTYSKSTSLGVFLSTEDADGHALIALNCV